MISLAGLLANLLPQANEQGHLGCADFCAAALADCSQVADLSAARNPLEHLRFQADQGVLFLVASRTENPCVGGSNPPLGTITLRNQRHALEP